LWDPRAAALGRLVPTGWVDLRTVFKADCRHNHHVNLAGSMFHFEVIAHTRTGRFIFQVHDEAEARRWLRCMEAALLESRAIEARHRQEALAAAELDHAHAERGIGGKVIRVEAPRVRSSCSSASSSYVSAPESSRRAERLKAIWERCLRSAIHGQPPQVFQEMFQLYDESGDYMMQVSELRVLLKELLWVRKNQLERTKRYLEDIHGSDDVTCSQAELDARLELGRLAQDLNAHYSFLNKDGFTSRAQIIQSSLDISSDGLLSEGEFVRGAPELILPGKELWMEARFYERVGALLGRQERHRSVESALDECEDEGGCVQH